MAARMHPMFDRLRSRLAPALLTAAGIALTVAGLVTYTAPAGADAQGSESPSTITTSPGASLGLLTFPPFPSGSASPSVTPSASPSTRVATRITIPALDIDLPIVKPPAGDTIPYCNVAMYLSFFSQPGLPGATYLFAHARTGMFLPLLEHSWTNNGASMIGMTVFVYTSDDLQFLYRIAKIRRHYPASSNPLDLPVKDGQLWLQTSEGPNESSTKLLVMATILSSGPADHAAAHPKAHPISWGKPGCQAA
jgi:sortase (surface protein transpeptidase)